MEFILAMIYLKNKGWAHVINFNEYADDGTHWIALYVSNNEITYFDSFGVGHVPQEIKKIIGHKNIKADIFRAHANNSIVCGYFCIGFNGLMLAGKTLIDYTSLFSPYDFEKKDSIIFSYLKNE